jgi:diguanylate cyclase (GGDEF)-like protein
VAEDRDNTVRITVTKPGSDARKLRATLTVLGGNGLGQLVVLDGKQLVIGRGEEADLRIEDDSLSRKHARFALIHGSWFVEDLKSTNGTFLNGKRLGDVEVVTDGARIQLGERTLLRFTLQDEREYEAARKLFESSVRDPLTGCFNRHYLEECLPVEHAYAKRHDVPMSVLFMDVDHFKEVNDEHGHAVGDEVLREVGGYLRRAVRTEDTVARYGGEEIVILVRHSTAAAVKQMADRLRAGVESLAIAAGKEVIRVTVTIGLATFTGGKDASSIDELLARADSALYRGKQEGRNRVEVG